MQKITFMCFFCFVLDFVSEKKLLFIFKSAINRPSSFVYILIAFHIPISFIRSYF